MYPEDVVKVLRESNGVMTEQAPLRDAPGALPGDLIAPATATAAHAPKGKTGTTAKQAPAASDTSSIQANPANPQGKVANAAH